MLGDLKRDMQQERPYMLNASSTSRADAGQSPGLLAQAGVSPSPDANAVPRSTTPPSSLTGGAPAPLGSGGEQSFTTEEQAPNVTAQEQDQYDRLMVQIMELLNGQAGSSALERVAASQDPSAAVGDVVATVGSAAVRSAEEAGEEIDDGVLFHAAAEAVEQIGEMIEAAGVLPEFTSEMAEQALYTAVAQYGNELLSAGRQSAGDNAAIAQGLDHLSAGTP